MVFMNRYSGIILAYAMCAMAHTFSIQRTEILAVRRKGARFPRMAHEHVTCAPFFSLKDKDINVKVNPFKVICFFS